MTEVKMVEWFNDHWYKITKDGKSDYYPSVTTKLGIVAKPFLAKWRGDIGNREADMRLFEAQERGTRIHAAWEILTLGGLVVFNPPKRPLFIPEQIEEYKKKYNGLVEVVKYQEEMLQLSKLQKFLEIVKPLIQSSELTVYSDSNRDAGTVDNVMDIKSGEYPVNGKIPLRIPSPGGRYIVDLKTGNSLDDNAFMQTAAYARCYEEMGLGTISGTLILHTGSSLKTGIAGLGVHLRTIDQVNQDYKDFRNVSSLWERKHKDDKPDTFEIPALITLKGEL